MSINGIENAGAPLAPEPHSTQQTGETGVVRRTDGGDGAARSRDIQPVVDRVEISDAARTLAQQAASDVVAPQSVEETPPSGEISSDRVRAIMGRLTEGFYDTADVRNHVANGVRTDLSNPAGA